MATKERNAGIDLLRIVSMLMVVTLHLIGKGGVLTETITSTRWYSAKFIQVICYCAVNCYALISGYVGINARHKMSGLIHMTILAVFYSFGISLIFYIIDPKGIGIKDLLLTIIPNYWYFLVYFGLYLFMPVMNRGINSLKKLELERLLLALFVIFSLTSVVFVSMGRDPFRLIEGFSIPWLMTLYFFGAYIYKYGINVFKKCKKIKWGLIFTFNILVSFFSKVLFIRLGWGNINPFIHYLSPTILIAAVALLMLFSDLKIEGKGAKIVSWFSQFSFSVYLIHEQKYIELNLMNNAFSWIGGYHWAVIPFIIIGCAIVIYIVCTAIDIVRFYLFRILHIKSLSERIGVLLQKVGDWLMGKVLSSKNENKEE